MTTRADRLERAMRELRIQLRERDAEIARRTAEWARHTAGTEEIELPPAEWDD